MAKLPGGFALLALLLLAAAFLLRLPGMFTEFWFDEIWSLETALTISHPLEIITRPSVDNNHPLNTLFLWLLGRQERWEIYRTLSLATGTVSVALMGLLALPAGRRETLATLVLGGFSSFLVLYSSEARGYAPAAFFALLCAWLAGLHHDVRSPLARALFWLAVPLGVLSHASFLYAYAGLLAWSAALLPWRRDSARVIIRALAVLHGIPLVLTASILALKLLNQHVGGGRQIPLGEVVPRALRLTLGLPKEPALAILLASLALLLAGRELLRLARAGDRVWILYAIAAFGAPVLALVMLRPMILYPRYFFTAAPFFLLLLGRCIGRLSRRGPWGAVAAILLLGLFAAGNVAQLLALRTQGRGHCFQALQAMAADTPGQEITVGSSFDFRMSAVVRFYAPRIPGKKFVYVFEAYLDPGAAPEWFIAQDTDGSLKPQAILLLPNGGYKLAGSYPYRGESGFSWYIFRKISG